MSQYTNKSDEELIVSFSEKSDTEAYRELVERYTDRFVRFAWLILGNRDDSEDAAQDAFVKIVRLSGRYRKNTPFAPWAFTLLKNICIDEYRKRKVRSAVGMEMIDYMHNMQCCHNEKENAIEVEKLLLSISEEERLIVSLRIYAEEEFASIAQKCGISIENAKKRFYRALEKLKNHLSRLDSSIRIK